MSPHTKKALAGAISDLIAHVDYDVWKGYVPELREDPDGETFEDLAEFFEAKLFEHGGGDLDAPE